MNLDVRTVNPLELPSLPLEQRRTFPEIPAVYLVISQTKEVLYVGKSINLQGRWLTHALIKKLKTSADVRVAWVEISDTALLTEIEDALINHFNPPLNIARKWVGKKKTINFSFLELSDLEKY